MDHPEPNINETAIECRWTEILTEVSLALDFARLGTSPAGVKLGLYLVSIHKVDTVHVHYNCVALYSDLSVY